MAKSLDSVLAELGAQGRAEEEHDEAAWSRYERRIKRKQARERRDRRRNRREDDLTPRRGFGRFVAEALDATGLDGN